MTQSIRIPGPVRRRMFWGPGLFMVIELITLIMYRSKIHQKPLIYAGKLTFWLGIGSLVGYVLLRSRRKPWSTSCVTDEDCLITLL